MPTFWVYPQPPIADPPELKKLTVCDRCFITGPWIVVSPNQFAPAFPPFPTLKNLVDDFQKNQQSRIDTFVNEAWEKAKKTDICPPEKCKYPWLCDQKPVKMTIGGTEYPPPMKNPGFYFVVEIWFEVRCRHAEQTGRPPHPPKAADGKLTRPD